jgi:quercetin dioxygenase-like cupin family protein
MPNIKMFTAICSIALLFAITVPAETPQTGVTLRPDQLQWEPNPRVPGLSVARMISKGSDPGPYVYRVRFPKGRVVQAHSHPDDRSYTILEGTWYVGWGETFDEAKLIALGPGSFYTEPAGVPHFIATPDGETVVQISGNGPTKVDYVDVSETTDKN